MNHFKESVTDFVKKLRAYPILATICGFEQESVPGVGTFYDYLNRFWLGEEPSKVIREPRSKKSKKPKKDEKLPDTDSNRVSDLVEQVLNGTTFEDRPEGLLQKILKKCAVKQSFDLKLCGYPHKLVFAGDGAP